MRSITALEARVREILLQSWDPIGIAGVAAARDEYDQYVKPITTMITTGTSVDELSRYLAEIETDRMGLKSDYRRAQSVAMKLREIARTP
ncbi:MAG: hypothetical protein QOF14_5204 [Hyphomicrobiales bacterium]|jgi:hypothetical protein|nr:hypothetical protein [Hyphomicrobiales bacterium]